MPDKTPFYFKNYPNLLDYVHEYGSFSFQEEEFNDLDAAVFSVFAYFPLEEALDSFTPMSVQECCLAFLSWVRCEYICKDMAPWFRKFILLAMALLNKKRYQDLKVTAFEANFSKEDETQFAAYCVQLDKKRFIICYRGTDRTLIGWKENLHLASDLGMGSYVQSKEFLKKAILDNKNKSFYVVGHSKGGNFATYAASVLSENEQKKLLKVYSLDGPGLSKEDFESDGHQRIKDRIVLIVPQFDVIGCILYHDEISYIVDAEGYFDFFIQHDPFTWKVNGKEFVKVENRTPQSKYVEKVLREFITEKVDVKDVLPAADVIFSVILNSGFTDALQIERNIPAAITKFLQNAQKENKENRKRLNKLFNPLLSCLMHHLPSYSKDLKLQKEEIKQGKLEEKELKKAYDQIKIK